MKMISLEEVQASTAAYDRAMDAILWFQPLTGKLLLVEKKMLVNLMVQVILNR